MSGSTKNVCLPLPSDVTNSTTTYEGREQFVVKYLERVLPNSDNKDVSEELKRTFTLDKHKSSREKRKKDKAEATKRSMRKLLGHKILGKNHGLAYKELLPLNEMWIEYIKQNLGIHKFSQLPTKPADKNWESVNQRLLKADYHGAVISVVRSKNANFVGAQGIILQETKNCFRILTPNNCLKTLPKDSSLFKFHLPNACLEVYGKEIAYRPAERSVKKFKATHLGIL